MSELDAEKVRAFLAQSSPAELLKILTPVLEARTERRNGIEHKIVLCEFYCCSDPALFDSTGGWDLGILALPPPGEDWKAFESQGYWESGDCSGCGHEISSYAKKAICPLCGTTVGLT